ncbi:hypothetical protein MN032_12890 [Agromyces atrinae]|nr:hypothetical protein [Agromyces atrinae]MCI2958592.1 hypothetical protein [Agromyces atrinae]
MIATIGVRRFPCRMSAPVRIRTGTKILLNRMGAPITGTRDFGAIPRNDT